MDDNKVIITANDSYGFEVLSPNFKPEIKIKFALDLPVVKRRLIKDLTQEMEDKKLLQGSESVNQLELDTFSKKYGEALIQAMILDWNLYDENGKLPINGDSLDTKLSARLAGWIFKKASDFFINPDKGENA